MQICGVHTAATIVSGRVVDGWCYLYLQVFVETTDLDELRRARELDNQKMDGHIARKEAAVIELAAVVHEQRASAEQEHVSRPAPVCSSVACMQQSLNLKH